ncbi:MAG: penicillin acylase family protein, partial [Actinomycetota bacterium]
MLRRWVGVLAAGALAAALVPASGRAQEPPAPPPEVPDGLRAYSIVPPGQDGFVDATLSTGAHYDDQLEAYASLVKDEDVTDDELSSYFHSMQFGPESIEHSYSPGEGATVYRDELGIPHIYGESIDAATFALGYVSAEDRLWQMDVFRHAARGTLAELVGPGEDDQFLEMDKDTRRNGYTAEEMTALLDELDTKHGETGAAVQRGLEAYSDGINAY